MSKRSQSLISTDREVASARPPAHGGVCAEYRIAGTPNLILRVMASGHRSWTYVLKRAKTGGRWQKYNIGPYPAVKLARARDEAVRLRRAVIDGIDPFDARTAGRGILTLEALSEKFITRYAKPNKRTWPEDERKLKSHINPVVGKMRADLVTKQDVVSLVDAMCDRGTLVHANRTLSLIRKLYNWAIAEGYVTTANPAQGVPMRGKEPVRKRTLAETEIRFFWHALDGPGFDSVTADALRVQFLLGARIGEVTGMVRAELALEGSVPLWTLPAARSKSGRDVPRPLPPMALAIIERRQTAAGDSEYLFVSPSVTGQPITPKAPTRALKRAANRRLVPEGFTPHDLRRTARSAWARLRVAPIVAKKILGHTPPKGDIDASVYDQHDYLGEMLAALLLWEDHLLQVIFAPSSLNHGRLGSGSAESIAPSI